MSTLTELRKKMWEARSDIAADGRLEDGVLASMLRLRIEEAIELAPAGERAGLRGRLSPMSESEASALRAYEVRVDRVAVKIAAEAADARPAASFEEWLSFRDSLAGTKGGDLVSLRSFEEEAPYSIGQGARLASRGLRVDPVSGKVPSIVARILPVLIATVDAVRDRVLHPEGDLLGFGRMVKAQVQDLVLRSLREGTDHEELLELLEQAVTPAEYKRLVDAEMAELRRLGRTLGILGVLSNVLAVVLALDDYNTADGDEARQLARVAFVEKCFEFTASAAELVGTFLGQSHRAFPTPSTWVGKIAGKVAATIGLVLSVDALIKSYQRGDTDQVVVGRSVAVLLAAGAFFGSGILLTIATVSVAAWVELGKASAPELRISSSMIGDGTAGVPKKASLLRWHFKSNPGSKNERQHFAAQWAGFGHWGSNGYNVRASLRGTRFSASMIVPAGVALDVNWRLRLADPRLGQGMYRSLLVGQTFSKGLQPVDRSGTHGGVFFKHRSITSELTPGDDDPSKLEISAEVLAAVNALRRVHGTAPLVFEFGVDWSGPGGPWPWLLALPTNRDSVAISDGEDQVWAYSPWGDEER